MKVVLHPGVRSDLKSILEWLASERPAAIEPLLRHIDEAIARLSARPGVAPPVEFGSDIRVVALTRHPYCIFYRVHVMRSKSCISVTRRGRRGKVGADNAYSLARCRRAGPARRASLSRFSGAMRMRKEVTPSPSIDRSITSQFS